MKLPVEEILPKPLQETNDFENFSYVNVSISLGICLIIVDIFFKTSLNEKEIEILKQATRHCPVHNSLSSDIDIQINFN